MGAGGELGASGGDIPAGWVISALTGLLGGVGGTAEEKEELAFSALVPAHQPLVVQSHAGTPVKTIFKHFSAIFKFNVFPPFFKLSFSRYFKINN